MLCNLLSKGQVNNNNNNKHFNKVTFFVIQIGAVDFESALCLAVCNILSVQCLFNLWIYSLLSYIRNCCHDEKGK